MLNIQNLVIPEASRSNRALVAFRLRRNALPPRYRVFRRRILEQNLACKFVLLISFSLQLVSAVTNSDEICQKESVCFKILTEYLCFSVCKQLVVLIDFTGLPNEFHEIIGTLKMCAKRSNAAARGLVPPKSMKKEKESGYMIICYWMSEGGSDGEVFGSRSGPIGRGPPTQSVNKYI